MNTHESLRVHLPSTLELWAVEQGPFCCRGVPGGAAGVASARLLAPGSPRMVRSKHNGSVRLCYARAGSALRLRGGHGGRRHARSHKPESDTGEGKDKRPPPLTFPTTVRIEPTGCYFNCSQPAGGEQADFSPSMRGMSGWMLRRRKASLSVHERLLASFIFASAAASVDVSKTVFFWVIVAKPGGNVTT